MPTQINSVWPNAELHLGTLALMAFDPGRYGAVCVMDILGEILDLSPLPQEGKLLREYVRCWGPSVRIAYVERIGYIPGDGPKGAFTFGAGYGRIQQVLDDHEVLFDLVDPRVWQASLKCMTGGNKTVSLRKAKQLWPERDWSKKLANLADGALIAEWARRLLIDAQQQKLKRMGK